MTFFDDVNLSIDHVHPTILHNYHAKIVATSALRDANKTVRKYSIEFENYHFATCWADACDVLNRCFVEDSIPRGLAQKVIIHFYPKIDDEFSAYDTGTANIERKHGKLFE